MDAATKEALEQALEFISQYEDIAEEGREDGSPRPNRAMQVCNEIREALGRR